MTEMSLIERLGGYEYLNEFYKRAVAHGFSMTKIKKELLEYRRQHNIFEVGDFVLRNDGLGNVLKVTSIEGEYANLVRRVDGESIWSWFKLVDIRHATDAEIKAGKRLEVNQ